MAWRSPRATPTSPPMSAAPRSPCRAPCGPSSKPGAAGERIQSTCSAPAANELAHGPMAADRAAQDGETDRGVLDAIRYHSLGHAGWDGVGRMLYLADFLEPGRDYDREERRALAARVPLERDAVLREVARRRIEWVVRSGWSLPPETVAFWNALVL